MDRVLIAFASLFFTSLFVSFCLWTTPKAHMRMYSIGADGLKTEFFYKIERVERKKK